MAEKNATTDMKSEELKAGDSPPIDLSKINADKYHRLGDAQPTPPSEDPISQGDPLPVSRAEISNEMIYAVEYAVGVHSSDWGINAKDMIAASVNVWLDRPARGQPPPVPPPANVPRAG